MYCKGMCKVSKEPSGWEQANAMKTTHAAGILFLVFGAAGLLLLLAPKENPLSYTSSDLKAGSKKSGL